MPHSPVTLTNIVFPLQRPVLPSTPPSYRSQVGDTEGRLGESSSGPSSRCSSRDNTPLDEISDPYARTHPFNTPTSVSPTDIDDKIGIEVDEKIKVDQIGYPGLVPGPKHHARFRSRSIPASLISLRYKLLNKLPFLKPKLDSQNRRSSITLESGHTSPTSPGATFRRDLRRVRKQVYLVMIGTIVSLILIFYAWNIEVLWNGENMRGTMGDWESGWNMTHQEPKVMRQWLHSHNDEMQGSEALVLALRLGYGSVEADVWLEPTQPSKRSFSSTPAIHPLQSDSTLVSDQDTALLEKRGPDPAYTLLTGHKVKDITGRTLKEMYLDPVFQRLEENNRDRKGNDSLIGLYPDDQSAEVQLVFDFKSDGDQMWPYVINALQPFLDAGYLTTYDTLTSTWKRGPLLIIGTGNTPLHQVYYSSTRIVFYDAPLLKLARPATIPSTSAGPATSFDYTPDISPMASSKFPVPYHIALAMPPWNPIISRLRRYTMEATRRGIQSRWWGGARKPSWVRRRIWDMQKEGGATWIGADDLVDAVNWTKERGRLR